MIIEYPSDEFIFLFEFVDEAREHLAGIEDNLLKLEADTHNENLIETIYRPMHSIKGMSGFVSMNNIKHLCHETEDLIDCIRTGKLEVNSKIIDTLIRVIDRLNKMLKCVADAAEKFRNEKLEKYTVEFQEIEYSDLIEELGILKSEKLKKIPSAKTQKQFSSKIEIPSKLKEEFIDEALEHLGLIDEYLLKIEENDYTENDISGIMRELHTIKGGAQIIISMVENDSIFQNPIVFIQKIAHCAETLFQQIQKKKKDIENDIIETLFTVVDVLKNLTIDFKNSVEMSGMPVDILIKLYNLTGAEKDDYYLKIIENQKSISADDFAFYNTAIQNIKIATQALEQLVNKPAEKKSIIKKIIRCLKTSEKAGNYHKKNEFVNFCVGQINFFDFLQNNDTEVDGAFIKSSIEEFEDKLTELENAYNQLTISSEAVVKEIEPASTPADKTQIEQDIGAAVIKVPMDKIDRLMNIVGELVISKGALQILSKDLAEFGNLNGLSRKTKELYNSFNRLSDELQNTVMNIRMLPVKAVFSRYPRMVRDIAKKINKKVKLITKGEETELDKTVIEKINDPLLHMIRNSIDHGIETPEERVKSGKPEEGSLILSAWNKGNNIYIELQDDGKGIDPEVIKNKAIEKKLISKDDAEKLTKQEILSFIFAPGFSTAQKVTEVSGRGVGMDVVRTNIISIGGSVELDSEKGAGTKILLILPLTLAVSKGLEILCGNSSFMIPLDCVIETLKISAADIRNYKSRRLFNYRNSILPIIDLNTYFNIPHQINDDNECAIIVVAYNNSRVALKVDKFLAERDIVVKPLPETLENIPAISGATIMPDGKIELILNVNEL